MGVEPTSVELAERLKQGISSAPDDIYQRYAQRLIALARQRLSPKLARRIDPEDVGQSAYRSFFIRARDGQFTIEQSGDLWRLLAQITLNKLYGQAEQHQAARRSLSREEPESRGNHSRDSSEPFAREPSPAEVLAAAEELERLMKRLTPEQRRAVELRLQDHTLDEIALKLSRSERTIRRWLDLARSILEQSCNAATENAAADQIQNDAPSIRSVIKRKTTAPRIASFPQIDPAAPLFHGDYHLERLIGSGGMCKVYEATQRSLGKRVCVKALRKQSRHEKRAVARFLQEANIVGRLRHPQIVDIHGLGRLPDGGYFMVMDWVDGHDLARECCAGPIAPGRACNLVASLAEILDHVHRQGVIHCDLKPANVLIDASDRPLLTDFGLARLLADVERDKSCGANYIAGTPAFMAPEQADSMHGPLGVWTDVYGLGALLYMLITARPPVDGNDWSEILDKVTSPHLPIPPHELHPEVPRLLGDICMTCLQKAPAQRFPSASALGKALSATASRSVVPEGQKLGSSSEIKHD